MRCSHCEQPAVVGVDDEHFCLDCYDAELTRLARKIRHLIDEWDDAHRPAP